MKFLALFLSLFLSLLLSSCRERPSSKHQSESAREGLYGVWESTEIRSREQEPPLKVTLVFNYYKNSGLNTLEMKIVGENNKVIQRKINVTLTDRQIRPIKADGEEIKRRDERVTLESKRVVSNLIWDYELIGNKLIIVSGLNKIYFKKSMRSVKQFNEEDGKKNEIFRPKSQ